MNAAVVTRRPSRTRALATAAALTALLAGTISVVTAFVAAAPASAAARVSVVNDRGGSTADLRYRTSLTISGSGFQSVKKGFGGVYVAFGWVKDPGGGSWRPSRGGVTGQDYRYIPDAETGKNQGYLRYVAFPGSSTASQAHGSMSEGGAFKVTLTVPGPTFQSVDRQGRVQTVDCRKVTCGVITIGAHNIKNAKNETFTPVKFDNVYDAAPPADTGSADPGQQATDVANPGTAVPGTGAALPRGRAKVTTDRTTAQAGRTLAFTASGFAPGEQVVAILDDGLAGVGPITAGSSGEVAGLLPLPADLAPGTHELRINGSVSTREATERFPVRAADRASAPLPGEPASAPTTTEDDSVAAARVYLVIAGGLFLLALLGCAGVLVRRRRQAAPEVTR